MAAVFLERREMLKRREVAVQRIFEVDQRLPQQVFADRNLEWRFEEFDWAVSSHSWTALRALGEASGEATLTVGVLDPDPIPGVYSKCDPSQWFEIPISASKDEYLEALNRPPPGLNWADSIEVNGRVIVWFSPSQSWAIWAERFAGLCVLGSRGVTPTDIWVDVRTIGEEADERCLEERSEEFYLERARNYG